jgi:hypothetical protein
MQFIYTVLLIHDLECTDLIFFDDIMQKPILILVYHMLLFEL